MCYVFYPEDGAIIEHRHALSCQSVQSPLPHSQLLKLPLADTETACSGLWGSQWKTVWIYFKWVKQMFFNFVSEKASFLGFFNVAYNQVGKPRQYDVRASECVSNDKLQLC